jgi:hypothetical protein
MQIHDPEAAKERVWTVMPVSDSFNLLIGNHYFVADRNFTFIDNYLNVSEQTLNAYQYRVNTLSYLNAPFHSFYYYIKIKGNQFLALLNAVAPSEEVNRSV